MAIPKVELLKEKNAIAFCALKDFGSRIRSKNLIKKNSVSYSAKDVILALIRSNLLEWEHEWQPLPPFQESYWSNIPTSDLVVGATNL